MTEVSSMSAHEAAIAWLDDLLWLTANTGSDKAARILLTKEMIRKMQAIRDGLARHSSPDHSECGPQGSVSHQ